MKKTILTFVVFFLVYGVSFSSNRNSKKLKAPKNVILLIGDGMGLAQIHAAMTTNYGNLNMLQFPVTGLHKTSSADKYITDSAAGATAFATGQKTKNYRIGLDSNDVSAKTILEYAEDNGLSTGLIATSSITHATPAAFIAHQINRDSMEQIASDFLKTDIDVIIGGGLKYFANRKDKANLIDSLKSNGYGIYNTVSDIDTKKHEKIAAFTARDHNKKISEGRGNMLSDATEKALEILSKNKNGFFLMIEGSFIDKGCHENDQEYFIGELLDFDKVVGLVQDFAEKNGETLVIVTADHETGGVSILDGSYSKGEVKCNFSKKGNYTEVHTGIMVPVFSYGPGATVFSGVYENTEIFYKIKNALDLK